MTRLFTEWAVLVALALAAYFYYVRPVLKRIPAFSKLWETEGSLFTALRTRFAGIKTLLAASVGQAVAGVVLFYDDIIPYATGVDFTPITSKVPGWVWPVLLLFWFYLIGKFRKYTDARKATQ